MGSSITFEGVDQSHRVIAQVERLGKGLVNTLQLGLIASHQPEPAAEEIIHRCRLCDERALRSTAHASTTGCSRAGWPVYARKEELDAKGCELQSVGITVSLSLM